MRWLINRQPTLRGGVLLALSITLGSWTVTRAQSIVDRSVARNNESKPSIITGDSTTALSPYFDHLQGSSSNDLVRRALASNGELKAARIEIEKAKARVRQAGLTPNPTFEFEQTTGRFTGSSGERDTSIGVTFPLEVGGQRRRRVELAQAELEAVEAEVADRERRLAAEVRSNYAEALAALRELDTLENLNRLDLQTTRFVQARVNEGESAPLELSLLRVEVDRLRSRQVLAEGRLKVALLRLQTLTGVPPEEPLRLREDLAAVSLPAPPASIDAAIEIALRTRPDLRLARLNEEVAQAGLRLARSLSTPDVTAFTRFTVSRSSFEETPIGTLRDRDKLFTVGLSVGIPVFNRNQGAKADASLAILQARTRREFVEGVVRVEVRSAYARYEAARAAVAIFDQGVIDRSNENINVIRAVYQLGEFRINDLISEQRRLLDSQREFTETLAEQYRALADLHAALGLAAVK